MVLVLALIQYGVYCIPFSPEPLNPILIRPKEPSRLVLKSLEQGQPIICVNINYRLGIFGFAAATDIIATQDDSNSPIRGCNFGIRDQRVGLEWISKNIAAFGGDPRKITIGGQSAGAASTHLHTLEAKYSRAKPLFRKAIVMSGATGCLGPITMTQSDARWERLCTQAGFQDKTASKRVESLRQLSAPALLKIAAELDYMFYPVVTDELTMHEELGRASGVNFAHPTSSEPNSESTAIEVLMGDADSEVRFDQQIREVYLLIFQTGQYLPR